MENCKIKVERAPYIGKDGKEYLGYYVRGNVRGRDIKAGVKATDFGGYELLDIVFDGADEADLVATPFEMTTEDGRVITGNTYAVQSVDGQTGEIYACKVKPILDSDKTKLEMLLR